MTKFIMGFQPAGWQVGVKEKLMRYYFIFAAYVNQELKIIES